jgi:transposase InsO family protein
MPHGNGLTKSGAERKPSNSAESTYKCALALEVEPSMSRPGDCWDNAPMESFFGTLKRELVHRERYAGHAEARRSLFEYIEVFYNRRRLHSTLGYRSPVDFEVRFP